MILECQNISPLSPTEHLREPSVRFARSHLWVDESERIGHLAREDANWTKFFILKKNHNLIPLRMLHSRLGWIVYDLKFHRTYISSCFFFTSFGDIERWVGYGWLELLIIYTHHEDLICTSYNLALLVYEFRIHMWGGGVIIRIGFLPVPKNKGTEKGVVGDGMGFN